MFCCFAIALSLLLLEVSVGSIVTDKTPQGIGFLGSCAVTGIDGNIYIFGGEDIDGTTDKTIQYDPISKRYAKLSPMLVPTRGACCVTHPDGDIYVIGGVTTDGKSTNNVLVQQYRPMEDSWKMGKNRTGNGDGISCGISVGSSKIQVFGDEHYVYDPMTNFWNLGPQTMPNRRYFAAVQGKHGDFYLFGETKAVDLYETRTQTWSGKADMPFELKQFQSLYHNEKIYVFGGLSRLRETSDRIIVYSILEDRWTVDDSKLPYPLKNAAGSASRQQIHLFGGDSPLGRNNHWIDLCRLCSSECEEQTPYCQKSSNDVEILLFALFLVLEFAVFCLLDKFPSFQNNKN